MNTLNQKQFSRLWMDAPVVKKVGIIAHDPKEDDTEEGMSREHSMYATQEHQHPENMWDMPATEKLHTTQGSLEKSGIRHYIDHPNNPENWKEGEGYDAPEVYSHKGKTWIHEGHHRIIASRLRGEHSIKVHHWDTGE
jgi:hypothetical protein